jgi:hypothetical protein
MIRSSRGSFPGAGAYRLRVYRANESKAFARNRPDKFLARAAITDRLARGVDTAGQRRFRDSSAVPDFIEKVILADHTIAIFEQVYQEVEDLRLDRYPPAVTAEFASIDIKYMI